MGMTIATTAAAPPQRHWSWMHFAALMAGNVALSLGPWFVRRADTGPVSAALWRLAIAVPFLILLAKSNRQQLWGFPPRTWAAIAGAGLFFATDLSSWHIGIGMTRMGNATLFGNAGSLIVMVWGLFALHRAPRLGEWAALACALGGAAILFGRSLQIDLRTAIGDLFCITAGLLYAGYILLIQKHRAELGGWSLLTWSSIFGLPLLLTVALARGEPVLATNWWPVIGLAVSSQLIGQGLLVYSLKHFSAVVIGLALLTQPIVAVLVGWLAFGEVLAPLDFVGMALVGAGLVLARSTQD